MDLVIIMVFDTTASFAQIIANHCFNAILLQCSHETDSIKKTVIVTIYIHFEKKFLFLHSSGLV